jgi:hypothetical protein
MFTTFSPLLMAVGLALPGAPANEVRGVVARVDPDKKELQLDGRGAARGSVLAFTLDASTEVMFGRQAAAPVDIPVGRRVRIQYEVRAGKAVAKVIHVTGARPARPTPRPERGTDDGALVGRLWRVGLSDREITVLGPGDRGAEKESVIAVPETAKLLRDGKPINLNDLKEGESVRVQAEKRDGKLVAKSVEAGVSAPTTPAGTDRGRFLSRLRLALQVVDGILKQLEDR